MPHLTATACVHIIVTPGVFHIMRHITITLAFISTHVVFTPRALSYCPFYFNLGYLVNLLVVRKGIFYYVHVFIFIA